MLPSGPYNDAVADAPADGAERPEPGPSTYGSGDSGAPIPAAVDPKIGLEIKPAVLGTIDKSALTIATRSAAATRPISASWRSATAWCGPPALRRHHLRLAHPRTHSARSDEITVAALNAPPGAPPIIGALALWSSTAPAPWSESQRPRPGRHHSRTATCRRLPLHLNPTRV
jgi:hypothetical protein